MKNENCCDGKQYFHCHNLQNVDRACRYNLFYSTMRQNPRHTLLLILSYVKKNTIFSRILTLKELFDAFQQHCERFPLVFTERTITECKGTSYCGWPLCLYDAVREKLFPTATYQTIGSQKRELSHVTRQVCSRLHARTSYLNRDKNAIHKWSRTVEVMDGYYLTGIKPLFGWRIMSWLWLCSLKVK